MATVVAAAEPTVIPVAGGGDVFQVRRIYCVGRNYAAHAREMGKDPDREPPFFFCKPSDAIRLDGEFPYPPASDNVHHEIELVAAVGTGGRDIAEPDALNHVFGYAVGLDMTRRDQQQAAKDMGRPWEAGKAFDHSAPIGPIHPASAIGHPSSGRIWANVNGEERQSGDIADLIWSTPETIAHLSRLFDLASGDLIFTGTPAGVGPVKPGDVIEGGVAGVDALTVKVI